MELILRDREELGPSYLRTSLGKFQPKSELFLLYENAPLSIEGSAALDPGSSVSFLSRDHGMDDLADARLELSSKSVVPNSADPARSSNDTSPHDVGNDVGPYNGDSCPPIIADSLAIVSHSGNSEEVDNPSLPMEVETMLRLLSASTKLDVPPLSELWKNRIQLSEALAEVHQNQSRKVTIAMSPETFQLSTVVMLQEEAVRGILPADVAGLALPIDTQLVAPDEWDEVAKEYGKALQRTEATQDLNPAFLLVFRHESKIYGSVASLLGYEHAFKAIQSQLGSEDDADPIHLEALANILLRKFEKWYGLIDLDESITCYQACLSMTDERHPRFITRVANLCNALQIRTGVTLDMADILQAERLLAQTKPLVMGLDEKDQSIYKSTAALIKIASWAVCRNSVPYDEVVNDFLDVSRNGYVNDKFLKSAIRYVHMLMVESKLKSPQYLIVLQSLAAVFLTIVTVVTPDNPTRLTVWGEAARLHLWLYEETKSTELGTQALRLYSCLCRDPQAGPEVRIRSASISATMHLRLNRDADSALEDLLQAYSLIPEAVSYGPRRPDQLRTLRRLGDIPAFVTSVALTANTSPERALRLLEQGRGVMWGHLLDQKASLNELEQKHFSMAQQFLVLRDKIWSSNSLTRTRKHPLIDADARIHATKLQGLLNDIRAQDGFGDFLQLPESVSDFQSIGNEGPVVAVNVSALRADALVITDCEIINMPLPKVTLEICNQKIADLEAALSHIKNSQYRANSMLTPILKWLWEAIAMPVLDTLGFFPGAEKLPRIWWLTTGPLDALPIHAAGDYAKATNTGIGCTVMDRAISSYVPTLRALQFARQRQKAISARQGKDGYLPAMLVSVPKTPNMIDLEHTTREADRVKSILTNQVTKMPISVPQLPEPRFKAVIDRLQASTIAHFACHAIVDAEDPSKSHLCLRDWGSSPLRVSTLMGLDLSDCQLVYLSACETAVNKNPGLRDEGLHISGGFQMAGAPNTVATWWEIEDRFPVYIATGFYTALIKDGSLDLTTCASSLHQAVLGLRNMGMDPIVWAAYVHFGA